MKVILKVFQQTGLQVFGKIITSLSTFLILGLIARSYGEEGTGIFTLALAYLSFFYLVADLGVNAHIIQDLIQKDLSFTWRRLLGLRLVWSIVLVAAAPLLVYLWPQANNSFQQAVLFGSLAIFGSAIFASANALFQSKLRYDLSVLASSVGVMVTLGITLWLSSLKLSIPTLLLGQTSGWLITGILAFILVRSFLKNYSPIVDLNFTKQIFKEAWPVSLALMLNLVYFRVDAFILSSQKSFADVGVYNLAYQVFQSALVLPTFIMNSFYPLMVEKFIQQKNEFRKLLQKALLLMLGISVLGMLITLVLSPLVIQLMTGGSGFTGSVLSLRILSLGFPAFFVSSVLMWTLMTMKKYKTMLVIYIIGLLTNTLLNWIFIPQFSYLASSWITVFSEYLILSLQLVILFPKLR